MSFERISLVRSASDSLAGIPTSPQGPDEGLHLYLSNPCALDLPKCGKITFEFRRGPVTVVEPFEDRPGSASTDLNLLAVVDVEECEVSESAEPSDDTEEKIDQIDEFFKEAKQEEPESEEEPEEEE